MHFTSAHQARAALCRHASSHRVRSAYLCDLDRRLEVFQRRLSPSSDPARPPNDCLSRFAGVERARILRAEPGTGFRPSTYLAWLRDWVRARTARTSSETNDTPQH